tara:strand:+ start:948 stop:1217 length:270 start_codon:yes stop_codon:yes gene_type:complete
MLEPKQAKATTKGIKDMKKFELKEIVTTKNRISGNTVQDWQEYLYKDQGIDKIDFEEGHYMLCWIIANLIRGEMTPDEVGDAVLANKYI